MGYTGWGQEYSPLRLEETRARLSDENAQTTARTKNVGFWSQMELFFLRVTVCMLTNDS